MKTGTHTRTYTPRRASASVLKRAKRSIKHLSDHPKPALTILGIGAGVLSGLYILSKFRNHH